MDTNENAWAPAAPAGICLLFVAGHEELVPPGTVRRARTIRILL